jgi:hypothetical protein
MGHTPSSSSSSFSATTNTASTVRGLCNLIALWISFFKTLMNLVTKKGVEEIRDWWHYAIEQYLCIMFDTKILNKMVCFSVATHG